MCAPSFLVCAHPATFVRAHSLEGTLVHTHILGQNVIENDKCTGAFLKYWGRPPGLHAPTPNVYAYDA